MQVIVHIVVLFLIGFILKGGIDFLWKLTEFSYIQRILFGIGLLLIYCYNYKNINNFIKKYGLLFGLENKNTTNTEDELENTHEFPTKIDFNNPKHLNDYKQLDEVKSMNEILQDQFQKYIDSKLKGSHIIGFEGNWGSGKTTFLEYFSKDNISFKDENKDKDNDKNIIYIYFSPWDFQGEKIEKIFINKIYKATKGNNGIHELFNNLMRTQLSKYLNLGAFESIYLQNQLEEITKKLKEENIYICCVIDDLERSSKEEVEGVFSLIKTSWNLRHFIFILVYDRNRLVDILTGFDDDNSKTINYRENYLSKITYSNYTRKGILTEDDFNETIIDSYHTMVEYQINKIGDEEIKTIIDNIINIIITRNMSGSTSDSKKKFAQVILSDFINNFIKKRMKGDLATLKENLKKTQQELENNNSSNHAWKKTVTSNLGIDIDTISRAIDNLYEWFITIFTKGLNDKDHYMTHRTYIKIKKDLNEYLSHKKDDIFNQKQPYIILIIYIFIHHLTGKTKFDDSLLPQTFTINNSGSALKKERFQAFTPDKLEYKGLL